MPTIHFTYALKRFFPNLQSLDVQATTISEALEHMDKVYPGMIRYILDDQGRLRQHVNIFLNGDLIRDKITLQDPVHSADEIYVMQALSGGSALITESKEQ